MLRILSSFVIVGLALTFMSSAYFRYSGNCKNVPHYRWENRLILLLSKASDHQLVKKQISILEYEQAGLEERHLRVFTISSHHVQHLFPNKSVDCSPWEFYPALKKSLPEFQYLLIGKDGGVKLRSDTIVSIDQLFSTIDAMPMRQQEMRRH